MTLSRLLSFFFLAGALAACNNTADNAQHIQGEIRIDGSSTVYPITEAVAEEFRRAQPKVKVTVGLSGTGGGFKKFSRGETDMNNASRHIKGEEIETCKLNSIAYTDVHVAFDGLTVVVNPQNTWVNDITVAELKKIWSPEAQGTITRWNQIRPEWPNEEFRLYGAGTESGTYDYFTEAIVGKAHSSRGDYTASEDDNVLVQGIAGDKNALGFFGFAYYIENKDKLKAVPVDNGNGAVTPSVETVKDKSYAPLSRPLFLYVNSKAVERAEVQAFVRFYLENGGALAQEVGFIPMTDGEYATQLEKFNAFVESHGGGAAQPAQ
ncbi:MAG TPA: PstS family phosphate ABC transporter substrate-binding protein [Chitinophagales bacterium]|nr:PstS family phosphate ABC transporter substrate-binding protein [Chitinophagales bacterium]